jgi:2-phosphosulfolactate phosphatase
VDIQILQLIEGAKTARGLAVIIDVFRAYTTACFVIENGAEKVIPVGEIEIAYNLKKENPNYLLIGERKGRILPGFDYGNSPAQIEKTDFTGKTVIQTTSAGTQGIVNAVHAEEIITGSFVNAKAVADYIRIKDPDVVSLVCMGYEGILQADEDTYCAEYIRNLLLGIPYILEDIPGKLKKGSGKRFFEAANQEWTPERDFYLCMQANRFEFVLKAEKGNEYQVLKKLNINELKNK